MLLIIVIDAVAALLVLAGSQIAFNPGLMRRLFGREAQPPADADQRAEVSSALRMVGVMIMACSFTLAMLFSLIFVYSRP